MLTAIVFSLSVAAPQALSVDEIVARHLNARGGIEALKALQTVVYSRGRYREGSYESERAFMALARPYLKIVSDPEKPASFREGYDGSTWEWYETPGIVLRTVGAAAAAGRHNIWVEGPFVDYREKGTTIESLGMGAIDGKPAFHLLMTLRDGFRREYFIDQETWLVTAERFSAPIHAVGKKVKTEERVGGYKRVGGIMFAHSYREIEIETGKELSSMTWGLIEVNRQLPTEWFSPPAFTRTPLQDFLEKVFAARSDVSAVRWIYHEFRRAHPRLDTREGVEFLGFQMAKMGDFPGGIALLEANVADNPAIASSQDALARVMEMRATSATKK